jgi:hypothetical protein
VRRAGKDAQRRSVDDLTHRAGWRGAGHSGSWVAAELADRQRTLAVSTRQIVAVSGQAITRGGLYTPEEARVVRRKARAPKP